MQHWPPSQCTSGVVGADRSYYHGASELTDIFPVGFVDSVATATSAITAVAAVAAAAVAIAVAVVIAVAVAAAATTTTVTASTTTDGAFAAACARASDKECVVYAPLHFRAILNPY